MSLLGWKNQLLLTTIFLNLTLDNNNNHSFYLYEGDALVFAFFEKGVWNFGLKDQGKTNGKRVFLRTHDDIECSEKDTEYPL